MGNPGSGVWLFILSMIVYGVAFDFFNISGSLFVNQETDESIRSSAQGLFMMMTNGIGAFVGMLCAQAVINHYVFNPGLQGSDVCRLADLLVHLCSLCPCGGCAVRYIVPLQARAGKEMKRKCTL